MHGSFLQEFRSLHIRPAASRPCQCNTVAKALPEGVGSKEMSTVSSVELKRETECLRMPSFTLLSAFDMDRQKKEREHGVTTVHAQEEFRTDKRHYTIIVHQGIRISSRTSPRTRCKCTWHSSWPQLTGTPQLPSSRTTTRQLKFRE